MNATRPILAPRPAPFGAAESLSLGKAQMIVKSIGLLTMITCPLWVLALFYSGDYQYSSSLILIPVVLALNVILALRISRNDPFLHLVLPIAIIFKLAACGLYMYMVRNVLGGG